MKQEERSQSTPEEGAEIARPNRSMKPKPQSLVVILQRVVWYVVGVALLLIALRIVLLLLGAPQSNMFATIAYVASGFFVQPVHLLFGYSPEYGKFVFEWQSLVAMAVYAAMAGVMTLVVFLMRRTKNSPR